MRTLAGIVLLLIGIAFPMGMLVWLNRRMKRKPLLTSTRTGMLLALNGILPLGLVLAGFWLLSPAFGASTPFRAAMSAVGLAVLALVVGPWWTGRVERRSRDPDAG
jgi:uncharacterized membrane protein